MRGFSALMLLPVLASAGTVYDFTVTSLDPAKPPPRVTQYFVQDGKVRVGAPSAKTAYLFRDGKMYVIDNTARVVYTQKYATLAEVLEHYALVLKQLETAAANAPANDRAEAQRKVSDMQEVSDRLRQPVLREYRMSGRFETVDGRDCRIWEEREAEAKRLEFCVAPLAAVPGGADILSGMRSLSRFRQGSNFAFNVEFGLAEWWSDAASFGGVPVLVREFKYDIAVSETTLTGMRQGVPGAALLELPAGYPVVEGPEYTQAVLR